MITRKNRANYLNNSFIKRGSLINVNNYNNWIRKTLIRFIVSAVLVVIVLIIQVLNFQAPKSALQFINEKLEYSASIGTYVAGVKKIPGYVMSLGNRALEAVKIEDNMENKFVRPVSGEISTYFNETIGTTSNVSNGIIFSSNAGENIYSVDEGVVIEVGSNKSFGNYIILKHKGELLSVYKYVGQNNVDLNQRVDKGQIIGITSDKLLLEVWYRKNAMDPIQYLDLSTLQL